MSLSVLRGVAGLCMLWVWCGIPSVSALVSAWLDVPFVAQVGNGCGPACISMVMKYWAGALHRAADADADEPVIRDRMKPANGKGVFAGDMSRYLASHGFRAYAFEGEWSDLEHHLGKGRPLIVALEQGPDTFHFLVVVGIDSAQGVLVVNDPARRKLLKWERASFEKAWRRCDRWTLLAVPQHEA